MITKKTATCVENVLSRIKIIIKNLSTIACWCWWRDRPGQNRCREKCSTFSRCFCVPIIRNSVLFALSFSLFSNLYHPMEYTVKTIPKLL